MTHRRPARVLASTHTAAQTMECGQCGRGGATVRLAPDGGGSGTHAVTDPPPSGCTDGDILYKRDRGHPLRFWMLDSRLAPWTCPYQTGHQLPVKLMLLPNA